LYLFGSEAAPTHTSSFRSVCFYFCPAVFVANPVVSSSVCWGRAMGNLFVAWPAQTRYSASRRGWGAGVKFSLPGRCKHGSEPLSVVGGRARNSSSRTGYIFLPAFLIPFKEVCIPPGRGTWWSDTLVGALLFLFLSVFHRSLSDFVTTGTRYQKELT